MGDRTYVKITIHTDYMDKLLAKYGSEEKLRQEVDADEIIADEGAFEASEVNYANWDTLENLLKEEEIELEESYQEEEVDIEEACKEVVVVKEEHKGVELASSL